MTQGRSRETTNQIGKTEKELSHFGHGEQDRERGGKAKESTEETEKETHEEGDKLVCINESMLNTVECVLTLVTLGRPKFWPKSRDKQ